MRAVILSAVLGSVLGCGPADTQLGDTGEQSGDGDGGSTESSDGSAVGDGDDHTSGGGDGDGDPAADGHSGDGDGDTVGDGDGDSGGDGDGDTAGDGDGDSVHSDPDPELGTVFIRDAVVLKEPTILELDLTEIVVDGYCPMTSTGLGHGLGGSNIYGNLDLSRFILDDGRYLGLVLGDGGVLKLQTCDGALTYPHLSSEVDLGDTLETEIYVGTDRISAWSLVEEDTGFRVLQAARTDSAGTEQWRTTFNTMQTQFSPLRSVFSADDNNTYLAGYASGQVPGQSPNRAFDAIIQIDDQGDLGFVRQEASTEDLDEDRQLGISGTAALATDSEGAVYQLLVAGASTPVLASYTAQGTNLSYVGIQKLTQAGDRAWVSVTPYWYEPNVVAGGPRARDFGVISDGLVVGYKNLGGPAVGFHIFRTDRHGKVQWAKRFVAEHELEIDAVEGTLWEGQAIFEHSAVSNDAIYLTGDYTNTFVNGSNPPPGYRSTIVSKISFDGDVEWTKLYRTTPLDVAPGASGSAANCEPVEIRALPDGDPVLVVRSSFDELRALRLTPGGDER